LYHGTYIPKGLLTSLTAVHVSPTPPIAKLARCVELLMCVLHCCCRILITQVTIAKPLQSVHRGAYLAVYCLTAVLGLGLLTSARAGPDPITLW
jgi:hypothetical protein